MRILFYTWEHIAEHDMIEVLKQLGHTVDFFQCPINDYMNDSAFSAKLSERMYITPYDFIFSFNYFPVISEVCKQSIPYISWVLDSPLLTLFCKNITNSCNYIFIFDKTLYTNLKARNIKTVHYLPPAVNVKRLDTLLQNEKSLNYSSDVSFLGSLYIKQNFYDKINFLPDYIRGYLDGIIHAQKDIHGYNFLSSMLTPTILSEIKKYVSFELDDNYFATDSLVFSSLFLSQKVTSMERVELISQLSKRYDTKLYSNDDTSSYSDIKNFGYVDYLTVMPKIFYNSKINLNITLRSIESGIPLRAFDIMGSKGFLLSNYQSELFDFFEPDVDFVYYDSTDDLLNKVDYYLSHEIERIKIAENGYKKVKEYHTYESRITEILKLI